MIVRHLGGGWQSRIESLPKDRFKNRVKVSVKGRVGVRVRVKKRSVTIPLSMM